MIFDIARDVDNSDIHVEVIDLLANRVEAEVGVAFFVACYSAFRKAPVTPALCALIPIENKRNFLDLRADVMEQVDPIFVGDPNTAAMKVLGG